MKNEKGLKNKRENDKPASAPYNFVPLNEVVIESGFEPGVNSGEINDKKKFRFDTYINDSGEEERITGHIDFTIETVTPLYIRDTDKKEETGKINPDFFSPGGRLKIPGSSIRGMVRTLVEIISWGKFGFFDRNRRLYFREVGSKLNLADFYRELLMDKDDYWYPKIQTGILKRNQAGDYKICPSQKIEGTQFYKVEYDPKSRKVAKTDYEIEQFDFAEIYFKPVHPQIHIHNIVRDNKKMKLKLKYAKVSEISKTKKPDYIKGYIVSSGDFGVKKHMHWIINLSSEQSPITIGKDVIDNYINNDETRDERANLIKMLEKHPNGVPCFFITNSEGKVTAFGHTGMFRIPYDTVIGDHVRQKRLSSLPGRLSCDTVIGDHVPQKELQDGDIENITDIPEAIFGKESRFASRVFFEDVCLIEGQKQEEVLMEEIIPNILSSPKPTTFQHYLEQGDDIMNLKQDKRIKKLKHWNDQDVLIRGNKLYWHRWDKTSHCHIARSISFGKDFINFAKDNKCDIETLAYVRKEKNSVSILKPYSRIPDKFFKQLVKEYILTNKKCQYTIITPVRPGVKFKGRIRFENLSGIELGALLFALDLPEKHYHKLGMGKPLGLGSVKITPTLFVSDRVKRYKRLFTNDAWELSEREEEISLYKTKFEKHILGKIKDIEKCKGDSLWDTARLKQLKIMLDWENTKKEGWLERTRYMEINRQIDRNKTENEFKDRRILPKPEEVVKNKSGDKA